MGLRVSSADIAQAKAAAEKAGLRLVAFEKRPDGTVKLEFSDPEVLAFKLFECRKDDPGPSHFRSVFHTAFEDPDAPSDAEERQSCEHRVGVVILRD